MEAPLVSIIVPVYNGELYLNRCLDGLLEQSIHNIEIVIINDGSDDSSADICKKYVEKDNRVKYYYQNNSGVSAARNSGLIKALGKYVMFSDCDDYYDIQAVEVLLKIAEQENADLVIGSVEKNIYNRTEITLCDDVIARNNNELPKLFIKLINNYLLNSLWGKLFRKSIIQNNKLYLDEKMSCGEDYEWVCRFSMHTQCVVTIAKVVYHYSIHSSESLSQKLNCNYFINIDKQYVSSKMLFGVFDEWDNYKVILIKRQIQNIINGYLKLIDCELTFREKIEYLKKCQRMQSLPECREYIKSNQISIKFLIICFQSPYLILFLITIRKFFGRLNN